MSLNHLLSQIKENKTLNPRFNSLTLDNGVDMKNSGISNVSTINGIPFSGIIVKPESIIIYRQGSGSHVPLTNVYGSWNEIKNVIFITSGAVIIYVDDSLGVPLITSNTDFQNRTKLIGSPSIVKPSIKIQDGVIISNLGYIENISLVGSFTTIVPLQYSQGFVLSLYNASLKFDALSTKPFIELVGTQNFIFAPIIASNFDNSLSPLTPIINMTSINSLFIVSTEVSLFLNNVISGGVASGVVYICDGSISVPTNIGMLGSESTIRTFNSNAINYIDTAPLVGSTDVQGALDLVKLSSTINYTDIAPLIGSTNVQGALDLVKLSSTINYTDTAPLIGSTNVQGALDLVKNANIINYDDTILPQYASTNVQGALDAIKPLLGGSSSYGAVGFSAAPGPAYVITVSNVPVTNISSAFNTFDNISGLTVDGYGIIIPNGSYRLKWSVAYSKNVNDPSYIGVMYTDLALVSGAVSNNVAYETSLLTVFSTTSGETYIQNASGNQYVQLYATSLGGNIDFTIYYWNISVQSV